MLGVPAPQCLRLLCCWSIRLRKSAPISASTSSSFHVFSSSISSSVDDHVRLVALLSEILASYRGRGGSRSPGLPLARTSTITFVAVMLPMTSNSSLVRNLGMTIYLIRTKAKVRSGKPIQLSSSCPTMQMVESQSDTGTFLNFQP